MEFSRDLEGYIISIMYDLHMKQYYNTTFINALIPIFFFYYVLKSFFANTLNKAIIFGIDIKMKIK